MTGLHVTDDVDALAAIPAAAIYKFCLINDIFVLFNLIKLRWGDLLFHLFCMQRFGLLTMELPPREGKLRKNWN